MPAALVAVMVLGGCTPRPASEIPQSNAGQNAANLPAEMRPGEGGTLQTGPGDNIDAFIEDMVVAKPTADTPVAAAIGVWPGDVQGTGTTEVIVRAHMADGWHIYGTDAGEFGIPMKLELQLPPGFEADGEWQMPRTKAYTDANGPSQIYEGEVVFRRTIRATDAADAGSAEIKCEFLWQACDANVCQPPVRTPLTATVNVAK
jgi:DsbC/DsbD-like thiol-disulfide interchange protein